MWGSPVVNTLSLPSHFASENVNRIEGTSELPAGMTTPTRSLQRPNFSSPLEETPPYRYPSAESVLSQHVIGNQDSPMQSAYALGPRQPALAASSPAKYIASALRFSPTGDQPRATGLMLTTSNFGGRHNTLQQVYLERTAALNEAFEQHGHRWPLFPVDAPTDTLPFTLTNPTSQSMADKLHHQELRIVNQINSYLRQQSGKLYLDALGERAYEGASADKFFAQSQHIIALLAETQLLPVVCAITIGNFVLTVDVLSTQVPPGVLQELLESLENNARQLRSVYNPMTSRIWQCAACTLRTSVTTLTIMQLIKLTEIFYKSTAVLLSRDMQSALKSISGNSVNRVSQITLPEYLRVLFLYEDSDQKHSLRREHLQRQLTAPLSTNSLQVAEEQWLNRLDTYELVFGHPPYLSIVDEFNRLMGLLPSSYMHHASTLQDLYAFIGYPKKITDVFQRLRAMHDARVLQTRAGKHMKAVSLSATITTMTARSALSYDRANRDEHHMRGSKHHRQRFMRNEEHRDRRDSRHNRFHRDDRRHTEHDSRSRHSTPSRSRSGTPGSQGSRLSSERNLGSDHDRSRSPRDTRYAHDDRRSQDATRAHRDDRQRGGRDHRQHRSGERDRDHRDHYHSRRTPPPPPRPRPRSSTPTEVGAQIAAFTPEQPRRPPSPHPNRGQSPRPTTPPANTSVSEEAARRRKAMMESRAKIAAVQAEADGMARLSVIRICPDGSGMEGQLPPTLVDSCNASIEQRTLSASTPQSNLAIPSVSVVSAASLQRRAALLHHKRLHENNMQLQQPLSAEATQNMLRIFHDASLNAVKTAHNGLSLVDTGAEVGASDVYDDCFITVVDTSDVIRLQAFDHARSGLTVLGSSLQMKIVQDDQGALSVVITKRYIVQGTSGIDIICVDDVKQAGGAVFIGTLKDMKVVQDVAGKDYHYHLPGNSSYLISPLGGATKLVRSGKLHYLPSFDASQSPTEEISALMDDVHAVYGIASKSARLQSYTAAVEIAHGRRQQLIAVNALRTPPPDLSLFPTEALLDPHRTDEGFVDPMQGLFDSCYRLQVQAAICQDKDTEQRQQLLRTLEATAFELQDIAPSSTFIGNVRVGSNFAAEPHVDFTGGDVTTSTGPAQFTSSIAGISEAGVIGSSSNDPQGPSVTADNVKHGMFRPKGLRIVVMNATSTIALLALYFLTVYPDSVIDVFSQHSAPDIYNTVPVTHRHRLFLHSLNPRQVSLAAMQLTLQDHNRDVRDVDLLHVEDLDPDIRDSGYSVLQDYLKKINSDVVLSNRTRYEDKSLGSRLDHNILYTVQHPQPMCTQRMIPQACRVDKRGSPVDQISTQIEWLETLCEKYDTYITKKYKVPICTGFFLYEDIAEIALKHLDADNMDTDDEQLDISDARLSVCTRATAKRTRTDAIAQQRKRSRLTQLDPVAVDIGAGSCTFCIEFLESNPTGVALAIDIMEPAEFWNEEIIPSHLWSRLFYHQAAPGDCLTKPRLKELLSDHVPEVQYAQVTDIHVSPECQTLSLAANTGARSKLSNKWKHPHRRREGSLYKPVTDKAIEDDRFRTEVLLELLRPWADEFPHVRITVENPRHSLFLDMSDVQELLSTKSKSSSTQWRIGIVDYCKLFDSTVDPPTSQKPTVFITYGYEPLDVQCRPGDRCELMLSDGVHHRYCIRNNSDMPPDQVRIEDPLLRSRIPRGVYRHLRQLRSDNSATGASGISGNVRATSSLTLSEDACRGNATQEACSASTTTSTPVPFTTPAAVADDAPSDSTDNVNNTGQTSTTPKGCKTTSIPTRRSIMPIELCKLYHARCGHVGRKRLYLLLRSIGLLRNWLLPNEIPCEACDIAKAKQAPHRGTLKPANYPNEIIHVDLMNIKVPDIHGNLHSLTIVDGKSRLKTVYPIRVKSDATKGLQKYFAYIRVKPAEIRVDAGGEFTGESATGLIDICRTNGIKLTIVTPHEHEAHGIVERAHQTLMRMAHSMLLAADLDMSYWSYALRYAAHVDQYMTSNTRQPAPYEYWHPNMPMHPAFRAFGAPLVYRQQEPDRQRKLDPRGHRACYLGPAEQHGSDYVLDLDIKSTPVRITNNVLKRTYREPLVIDIKAGTSIDPEMLDFQLIVKSSGEIGIEQILADYKPVPLPADDLERVRAHQEFCAQRAQQLHASGMGAYEANTTILREWHLEALRQAHRSTTTTTTTPTSNTESSEPTPKTTPAPSTLSRSQKKQLCLNPDVVCVECGSPEFDDPRTSNRNKKEQVHILLCDACDQGFHNSCLGIKWHPRSADGWYCPACLVPGTQIEVQRTGKQKSKYLKAKVTAVADHDGLTEIQYEEATDMELIDLRRHRWRLANVQWNTVIASINEIEGFMNDMVVPKSMQHIERMNNSEWKAKWKAAAYKELDGLYYDANMFDLVDSVPEADQHRTIVPTILLFKYKPPKSSDDEGICKCRCVCLGNRLDLDSAMPAPTPRMPTFRMMLSLAAKKHMHIAATDCTQAFANAKPMDVVYVKLPNGFHDRPYNACVARLKQNMYGLKSAPYAWYTLFSNFMLFIGFKQNPLDPCLYQRVEKDGTITYVLNYVDDAVIFNERLVHVEQFKSELAQRFKITSDKHLTRYLGIDILRTEYGFVLSQQRLVDAIYDKAKCYIEKYKVATVDVPMKFGRLKKANVQATPEEEAELKRLPFRSLLGAVGYLMTSTMPSIAYAYKEISRFAADYRQEHFVALLELITYIQKHPTPLIIAADGGDELQAFSDADWNNSKLHLSTSGFVIFHGLNPVSWASRTQRNTSRSVGESEFISLSACAQELQHIRHLKASINQVQRPSKAIVRARDDPNHVVHLFQRELELDAAQLFTDSASTRQSLQRRQTWSEDKLRHVGTAFHYVRGLVRNGNIDVLPVKGKDNCSDTLTKGYESTPGRVSEFNRLARICHGFRPDTPRDIAKRKKHPEWQPTNSVL